MHSYILVLSLYHFYCELHYLAGCMVAAKVLLYGIANRLGKRIIRKKSKSKIDQSLITLSNKNYIVIANSYLI